MPNIDQFNRFARVSMDIYCSTKQVRKGVDRHLQNATDVGNILFQARLEFSCKTGCVPQYFQYKDVLVFFQKTHYQILRICLVLCCSMK